MQDRYIRSHFDSTKTKHKPKVVLVVVSSSIEILVWGKSLSNAVETSLSKLNMVHGNTLWELGND